MSLTTTAPLSLPPHAAFDRPHTSSMSYPPAADRTYPGYYSRPAPGSAHGAPPPPQPEAPSPERLHSAGGPGAAYAKGAPPQSPSQVYPPHDIGPAPGSSHGYPAPTLAASMSGSAGYPPQPPQAPAPYYGVMPGQNQDPNITSPPSTANSRSGAPPAGATSYTVDGAPIVPVGISGGKMFRCRGFGECDKVFTRSEHLARHVRKHTGERPFPCHCGKAFSRLDNLRQHAATVHADQTHLNESMLSALATVHAALSQRANREQRRRGEVVEVPKNAVERPRGERGNKGANPAAVPPAGAVYAPPGYHPHQQWGGPPPHDARPRTAESWMGYPSYVPGVPGEQHPPGTAGSVGYVDDAGPSRRPPSAGYPHTGYYSEPPPPPSSHGRPATATAPPCTAGSGYGTADDSSYRPVSSNGREIPVPGHYADSEPPTSAHGPPPHSPMYPHPGAATVPAAGSWTSPPHHPGYPPADPSMYPQGAVPPTEGQQPPYPPGHPQDASYGPPPPGSSGGYYYPPQQGHGYYGQQSPAHQQQATFPSAVPPPGGPPPPAGAYPPNYNAPPGDSPFQYNAGGPYPYPAGYDGRKRRADDEVGGERKHSRNSTDGAPSDQPRQPGPHGELWLPPASERRSSLAISALLGSPQQDTHSSRPNTGDVPNRPGYAYAAAPAHAPAQYDDRAGGAPLAGGVPRERPGNPADEKKVLVAE